MFGENFFISATAQPFTVMFSSDNFEGQHGKNQLKKLFLITLGSWIGNPLRTLFKICTKLAQINKNFGRFSMKTYPN